MELYMSSRIADLRLKEVINISTGERLGFINDVEVDVVTGRVVAVIVPGPCKFGIIPSGEDYIIPWGSICKIGEDIVLVEFDTPRQPTPPRKHKSWF